MALPGMKIGLVIGAVLALVWSVEGQGQLPGPVAAQSCPLDLNFARGTLVHWQGVTGNNKNGNGPDAILQIYDSTVRAPNGTIDATGLPEYELPGVSGISVITQQGTDVFGSFNTIPTINGHAYHYSVLLGSTSVAPPSS